MTESWIHPLTNREYTDRREFAQSLIDAYATAMHDVYVAHQDERVITEAIKALAGDDRVVEGTEQNIAITPQQRAATYPRSRGSTHPLKLLLDRYPKLRKLVRIDYSESGGAVQRLIDQSRHGKLHDPEDLELAEELNALRKVCNGKPVLKIVPRGHADD